MSDLSYPNYLKDAEDKLLSQFKDKKVIKALLLSALKPLQQTQDSLIEYSESNNLDQGTGKILDVIGKIVGERRLGRSDEVYREAIYNRIVINVSEGTRNQLLEILILLSGGTEHRAFEHFPLQASYYTNGRASKSLAKTLTSASPITTERANVYHDPNSNALIPCELENDLGILVDNENREVVNEESLNIAVTYLSSLNTVNSEKAILDELDLYSSTTRKPCEVYE